MVKKRIWIGLLIISLFIMCGCGADQMPDVSEAELGQIGEYAAVLLMKYDANNRSRLVDQETIDAYDRKKEMLEALKEQIAKEEEEKIAQAEQNKEEAANKEEEAALVKPSGRLEDFFTMPAGVTLAYAGYSVEDSYADSGDSYFSLEATEGKKLLAVKFLVSNSTAESQYVDFFGYQASYRLTVNKDVTRGILTTMLLDDLATFSGEIAPQSTNELVLLTEMDESVLQDINSIVLKLKNASNECTIQLY